MNIFLFYLLVINILSFILFGYDKFLAINNKSRISEKNLFILLIIGGSLGGGLAMFFLRHKVAKWSFFSKFLIIVILQLLLLFYCAKINCCLGNLTFK